MIWNLLTDGATTPESDPWGMYITIGVIIILFVVMFIFNKRSQKKRQKELEDTLNAVKPGSKVKTIGGICGIVVEVCPDDNTFVLETGNEANGKCFIRFDKQAIYQTDAVPEKTEPTQAAPVAAEPTSENAVAVEETTETAEETQENK